MAISPVAKSIPETIEGDLVIGGTGTALERIAIGSVGARLTRKNGDARASWRRRALVDAEDFAGVNAYVSGTAYSGKADALTGLQAAADAAIDYDDPLVIRGGHRVDGTLVIKGHLDAGSAELHANGQTAIPAIQVGDGTTYLRDKRLVLPKVTNGRKTASGWAATGVVGSVGVRVRNMIKGSLEVPYIYGFETGLWMNSSPVAGVGQGTEHVRVFLGQMVDNQRGLRIAPDAPVGATDSFSWVNECKFFDGSFAHSLAERSAGPTWYQTDARHILIDAVYGPAIVASRGATGGSGTTVVDSALTATLNQYAGRLIRLLTGTGSGQERFISSNTAGSPGVTLTISGSWVTAPDATTTYEIVQVSKSNSHRFFAPSLQGDVAEYHVDIYGHENSIYAGRWETHQPGVVFPKVRLIGPFATENSIESGYDSETIVFTISNGANSNHWKNPYAEHIQGGAKGGVVIQNESSNNTGAIYIVPSGTALGADPTSIYTVMIASAQVLLKGTGHANPMIKFSPSGGTMEFGDSVSAPDAGITRGAANVVSTLTGDSFRAGPTGAWNAGHLLIGAYHLWVDATGALRIKASAPASDTDGVVVGTQT